MTLEVPPTRLPNRTSHRSALAVLAACCALVIVGFVVARSSDTPRADAVAANSQPAAEARAVPDPQLTPETAVGAPPMPVRVISIAGWTPEDEAQRVNALAAAAQPIPADLSCHRMALQACRTIVRAALDILEPGATVRSAAAWPSLLCGDSLDCPPSMVHATQPLGSVILQFADGGPSAWVNVVRTVVGPKQVSDGTPPQAWFVTHPD